MDDMAISRFKATCLSAMEQVRKTRQPLRVTRFGVPVAEIVPPSVPKRPITWIGSMSGTGKILGDIVAPAVSAEEWEVLRQVRQG